ncbi:MAG TPA: glycosyltransferase [Thermoanaerobaculia bacterium]|nr:glycosyltransferase [Thermoanaerobaculia bacterium]
MRIAQIVLPSASEFERKHQRADLEALRAKHEIVELAQAEIAHVYASGALEPKSLDEFPVPYVSSVAMKEPRWSFRKPRRPGRILDPVDTPEAVEERYWNVPRRPPQANRIGSFHRPGTRNMVEQTLARIHRFRDDVTWDILDHPPTPDDLSTVDLWVDPAIEETDFDGYVAEALVIGLPVVAARTPMNAQRLEKGRTGWLVPVRDPNEMTHAILAGLFKREVAENKLAAARQTISKFKARQRMRVLSQAYETLIP